MYSLLSRSTDVKLTGEATTWDLMTFVCTDQAFTFFLPLLSAWSKYSEVSVKLKSERSWKPTSCASSQLQRVRLFFSSFWNTESCWIWAPTVSLKSSFSAALRLPLCFSPPFVSFYRVLANSRTTRWSLAFQQETMNGEAHVSPVPWWHCSHHCSAGVLQGCWASGGWDSWRERSGDFFKNWIAFP